MVRHIAILVPVRPGIDVSELVLSLTDFAANLPQAGGEKVERIDIAPIDNTEDFEAVSRFCQGLLPVRANTRLIFGDLLLYFPSLEGAYACLRFLQNEGYKIHRVAETEMGDLKRERSIMSLTDLVLNLAKISRLRKLHSGKRASLKSENQRGGNPRYGNKPNEAKTLERIRAEKESGKGPTEIANGLNADAIPARRAKKWHPSVISSILGVPREAQKRTQRRQAAARKEALADDI